MACSTDGKMTNTFDSSKEVKTTAVDYTELRAGISSVKQLRVSTSPVSVLRLFACKHGLLVSVQANSVASNVLSSHAFVQSRSRPFLPSASGRRRLGAS